MQVVQHNLTFQDYLNYSIKNDNSLWDCFLYNIDKVTFEEENEEGISTPHQITLDDFLAMKPSQGKKYQKAIDNYIKQLDTHMTNLAGPQDVDKAFTYKLLEPITIKTARVDEELKEIKIDKITFEVKTIGDIKDFLFTTNLSTITDSFMVLAQPPKGISAKSIWNKLSLFDGLYYSTIIYNFFIRG